MRAYFLTGPDRFWLPIFIFAIIVVFAVMPGFFGGGADDWRYLNAARCWVDHGPCLPTNYWEGRWPAVLPLAAIISVFGEFASNRCVVAADWRRRRPRPRGRPGNKLAGRPAGWLVGILLLFTPSFSIQFLTPSVELLELAFLLAGGLCVATWVQSRSPAFAALAGFAFAMAFQVRETAIVAVGLATMFVITLRPDFLDLAPALAGFLAPLIVEFALYWHFTGDPFYRRNLSVAHTLVPSSELLGPVDTENTPFFNKAYISNWRREPGVHVHWLIDGFLNFFVNARAGWSLPFAAMLLTAFRAKIPDGPRRPAIALFAFSVSYIAVLIYVLAVDPKPRIFWVPLTLSSLAFAILLVALWRHGEEVLAKFLLSGHILSGAAILIAQPRISHVEGVVAELIKRHPGAIELDPRTLEHLALVPGVSGISDLDEERPFLLHATEKGCSKWPSKLDFLLEPCGSSESYR